MPEITSFDLTESAKHNLAAAICLAGISGQSVGEVLGNFDECGDLTMVQLEYFAGVTIPNQEAAIKLAKQLI